MDREIRIYGEGPRFRLPEHEVEQTVCIVCRGTMTPVDEWLARRLLASRPGILVLALSER